MILKLYFLTFAWSYSLRIFYDISLDRLSSLSPYENIRQVHTPSSYLYPNFPSPHQAHLAVPYFSSTIALNLSINIFLSHSPQDETLSLSVLGLIKLAKASPIQVSRSHPKHKFIPKLTPGSNRFLATKLVLQRFWTWDLHSWVEISTLMDQERYLCAFYSAFDGPLCCSCYSGIPEWS